MKKLGMVRRLDNLGRITIPMELRKTFGIKKNGPMEIYVDGDSICLKAAEETKEECALCGSVTNLIDINGKKVCRVCSFSVIDVLSKELF